MKASLTVNLLLLLVGLGLIGSGIYYCTKPLPSYLSITSATKQGSLSSRKAAEFLSELAAARPWDPSLAEAAATARRRANRDMNIRVLVTALFVVGGIGLGVYGGRRIATGPGKTAVPPTIAQ